MEAYLKDLLIMNRKNLVYKLAVKLISLFYWPPIRAKAYRESRLKDNPFPDVLRNACMLPQLKDSIDTVVLGSSHAHYGFHAEESIFNLGGTSCDLYHSYELYRWLDNSGFEKVKTMILFYDVFSPGFVLEKTSDALLHIPCEICFGIPARDELRGVSAKTKYLMEERTKYHYKNQIPDMTWRGNGDHHVDMSWIDLDTRIAGHLKHCWRNNHQTEYVRKMLDLAKVRSDRFIVVLPPLRADYREKLKESPRALFPELFRLASEEPMLELLDYHDCLEFSDEDFIDYDHLNARGAKKLAQMINNYRGTPRG